MAATEPAPWRALPLPLPRRAARATRYLTVHLLAVPFALGLLAWTIQHSAADMALSRLFVDAATGTFAGRPSLLLEVLGHHAARGLPFLIGAIAAAGGIAGFRYPPLRPWTPILLAIAACHLLGPLVVNLMKDVTAQHCPSAQQSFGGVIDYAEEQAGPFWAATRQAAGHCLPSGHAAGGYALLSLYFAGWAAGRPAWRWRGLAIGIATGVMFSVVRLAQGAHFASATVWSAAVDWAVCAVVFLPLLCGAQERRR